MGFPPGIHRGRDRHRPRGGRFVERLDRQDINDVDMYVLPNNVGVNENPRQMYGVTPGKNLFRYDTVVPDLLVVFDTMQESAGRASDTGRF